MTLPFGDSVETSSWSLGDLARVLLTIPLLLTLPVVLTVVVMSRTRASLLWFSNHGSRFVPGDPTPHRVVSAVKVADDRLPVSRSCLVRSLTAETMLQLYAFEPNHKIGVTTESTDSITAHSWLEYRGEVLIGDVDDLDRYEPLPSIDDTDEL